MDNITIVFCEGQHDIAFLSKILYVHGYKEYKKKLKVFEEPFGEQYLSILREEKNISDKKLGFNPIYKVPSVALYKNESLVLFHNMEGDDRETERTELLKMYQNLQGDDDFSSFNFSYKFLYFFDADEKTINDRVDELNSELALDNYLYHNKIISTNSYQWGCYIFTAFNNKSGYLEDILLDLMIPNNRDIFQNSREFIASNCFTTVDRQCEYKPFEDNYKNRSKFKNKKSIISVAGQLQFSGMTNAVIIGKSDFIKKDDILNSEVCNNIMKMFEFNS